MNGLREKFRNKKGFTLVEMLIVVAIIAILVAVSIPIIGNALESTRDTTDQANERAAKAEAILWYMNVDPTKKLDFGTSDSVSMYYDAANGTLVKEKTGIKTAYGQCTEKHDTGNYITTGSHVGSIIQVTITKADATVTIKWETLSGGSGG